MDGQRTERAATAATGLRRLFPVLCLLGRSAEIRCFCCRGGSPSLCGWQGERDRRPRTSTTATPPLSGVAEPERGCTGEHHRPTSLRSLEQYLRGEAGEQRRLAATPPHVQVVLVEVQPGSSGPWAVRLRPATPARASGAAAVGAIVPSLIIATGALPGCSSSSRNPRRMTGRIPNSGRIEAVIVLPLSCPGSSVTTKAYPPPPGGGVWEEARARLDAGPLGAGRPGEGRFERSKLSRISTKAEVFRSQVAFILDPRDKLVENTATGCSKRKF